MLLRLRDRTIDCTTHTALLGILNVATDSPVAASVVEREAAVERGRALHRAGAAIVDVGAHSTRSGARAVTPQEEIDRLCPVIAALAAEGIATSVDTWTPRVARAAAEAGVHVLNDVSGARTPAMVAVAVEYALPIIVMHMRGEPTRHREVDQRYANVGKEVRAYLAERVQALTAAGVAQVWVDPGFAFGKGVADNARLLLALPEVGGLGAPVVISASRKGFLAELMGEAYSQDAAYLREATLAFNVLAAWLGAHVVRVHDVAEVRAALRVVDAVRHLRDRDSGPVR